MVERHWLGTQKRQLYWSIIDPDGIVDHIDIFYKGPTGLWLPIRIGLGSSFSSIEWDIPPVI